MSGDIFGPGFGGEGVLLASSRWNYPAKMSIVRRGRNPVPGRLSHFTDAETEFQSSGGFAQVTRPKNGRSGVDPKLIRETCLTEGSGGGLLRRLGATYKESV